MKSRKFLMIGAGVAAILLLVCIACVVLVTTTTSSPNSQATTTAQALARVTQTTETAPAFESTPTGIPQPSQTAIPTSLPLPPTSTATQTITSIPVTVSAKQTVNVRKGPGTQFAIVGKLLPNTRIVALGKNQDGKWLQVAIPDAANPGWVSTSVVNVAGAMDSLQLVAVTPSPTATKTPTSLVPGK